MSENIRGFDGIRALSALSVVVDHAGFLTSIAAVPAVALVQGVTGVTWFFVLSGFLITRLLCAEHRASSTISITNFYLRRFLRIFPIYYLTLAIAALLAWLGIADASPAALDLAAAYVYNFVSSTHYYSILGHTWSLAVEEHFYVLWPLLLNTFYRRSTRLLMGLLTACIALAYPLLVVLVRFFPSLAQTHFLQRWTPIAGSSIAWGCLAALLLDDGAIQAWLEDSSPALAGVGIALYLAPLARSVLPWALPTYIQAVGITCLILWIVLNQRSRVVRMLEVAPLRYLGKVSYGIYMYQGLLLTTGPARPGQHWPLPTPVALVLLACVVPISYHFIERPLLRLKSFFHSDRSHHDVESSLSRPRAA